MLPNPAPPHAEIQPRTQPPSTAPSKRWKGLSNKLIPGLIKFYLRRFVHPVHIPERDKFEILSFCQDGPSPHIPPQWINWDNGHVAAALPDPTPAPPPLPLPKKRKAWKPFMAGGGKKRRRRVAKKCRCGSSTHKTTRSKKCPLNPRNRRPLIPTEDPKAGSDSDSNDSELPPPSLAIANPIPRHRQPHPSPSTSPSRRFRLSQ